MLPPGFEFSQGSLQDYVDCHRRFQLRYLLRQEWPAIEVEPALEREQHALRGQQFHHLVERYYLGVPAEAIEAGIQDDGVRRWWAAFLKEPPLNLPEEQQIPEVRLTLPLAGQRLVAIFDLLALDSGRRMVIVDWKTDWRSPSRDVVRNRLQTRVYPFMAVEAGAHLFGEPVDPARVTMVYWFANAPQETHTFHYDARQHEENRLYLTSLIEEIVDHSRDDAVWSLTPDEQRCGFCVYRSLCNRGVAARDDVPEALSDLDEGDAALWAFDLEAIDEIAY